MVDYGGLFHDEPGITRGRAGGARSPGLPAGGLGGQRVGTKLDRLRPIAAAHDLTLLQLACAWTLAQPAVATVAPTLIQEAGAGARPIEAQRDELAATPAGAVLSAEELAAIAEIGDNTGSMALKGGSPGFAGDERPDAWPLDDDLRDTADRWGLDPERDLALRA